jgi:glycosyltransferase involved in cell wall biosynthesis
MTHPQPLITVIIPTYNEAGTLEEAVRSIMEQTYQNLEMMVVDDQSTDNTKDIAIQLSKEDARVRYLLCPLADPHRRDIRGVNISVGYLARNYAMDRAQGEWITFQDADDASLLNRIEIQLGLARKYNATCITTSWVKFDEKRVGKTLSLENFLTENQEEVIAPREITALAKKSRGLLMRGGFPHHLIPFIFKKRWPTRALFLGEFTTYPGADSAPFFRQETVQKVRFRKRDARIWPAPSGRGVGRDHLFQLAETYQNSYSFKIPLYLWRQGAENPEFLKVDNYLT